MTTVASTSLSSTISVAERLDLLAEVAALASLPEAELRRLAHDAEISEFDLGQAVYRAGDAPDAVYLIAAGRARVIAVNEAGKEVTVATLSRGQMCGEQGALTHAPHRHSVRAMGELTVLRFELTTVARLLQSYPELRGLLSHHAQEASLRQFLKLTTAFTPLSPEEIEQVMRCLRVEQFSAGQTIYPTGAKGEACYVLRAGNVQLVQHNTGGRTITPLQPGDVFGELALLTGEPREHAAVAREATSVFRLSQAEFEWLTTAIPAFKEALVNVAAGFSQRAVRDTGRLAPLPTTQLPAAPLLPPEVTYDAPRASRYPALMQLSESDCGAACMAMVLRFYGRHVSINRLRDVVNVGRDGASLHSIAGGAETLGFQTRGLRAAYEHLTSLELPAIVHWEGFHYVVLYEAHAEHVVIADPAIGLRRLSKEEFLKGWTGFVLTLQPTARIEDVEESQTTARRFLPLLKPYRKLLLEILLASLVLQVFGLAMPIFTQVIVDRVVVHQNATMLNLMLIGMLLVAFFQTATVALRHYLMTHTTRRIDLQMVVNFYQHLLSLPLRYFEERKIGDILKRFNENARLRDLLTGRLLVVMLDAMMIVVYLSLMFYYNAGLTLAALLFMPGYAVLARLMTPRLKKQYRAAFAKEAEADAFMVETIGGIATIKTTANERRVRWRLEGLMVKALNAQFRSKLLHITGSSFSNILQTLSGVLLLWYGARLVMAGELSVGQLVAFNVLLASLMSPIRSLIDLWNELQEASLALERLNDVFDAQPESTQGAKLSLPAVRGHVRFSNVTFRYATRADRNVLQGVDLEIQPGQTVALVGRSGAGKTTFANLLLRLHQPNEGRIYLDGYDLEQVSLDSLRSQIGVVAQDVFLFSGSIRENIALGDPDAPLQEVVGAAMLAGAHEFISELPLGYETRIGERGQSLSGGQRQRLAIARALYKKPRILIFDEATSALDTESERAIQQNLNNILRNRTTFIIAHRLSTVRHADLIVVLDRGVIVETGTHESLMQEHGLYYYLCNQQLES
ncbi:MAG: peptidase domain-containing ABC transporter [Acidobacteria bacterium]|nr:peptidase domain-containing ABC transporter [Acidobacteriota bacterium]